MGALGVVPVGAQVCHGEVMGERGPGRHQSEPWCSGLGRGTKTCKGL